MGKRPTAGDIAVVMAELGRRGAAAKNGAMKPEERRALASKAAHARWKKAQNGASPLPPRSGIAESAETESPNKKGADQLNHERDLVRQEKRFKKEKTSKC